MIREEPREDGKVIERPHKLDNPFCAKFRTIQNRRKQNKEELLSIATQRKKS